MSRPRATDLLEPLGPFTRLCLCGGCVPAAMMKRTWVCFTCRTTQRKVGHLDIEVRGERRPATRVICQSCGEQMRGIPLAYSRAVPRKTNDRAWKLFERSLDRKWAKPSSWWREKKLTNRKAKRVGKDVQLRSTVRR